MLTFILLLVLALVFGLFATLNVQQITVNIPGLTLPSVPLYIVIGLTLLLGLGFSWLLSLANRFSTSLKMRGKDNTIKHANENIGDLNKTIKDLELENARLKGKSEN